LIGTQGCEIMMTPLFITSLNFHQRTQKPSNSYHHHAIASEKMSHSHISGGDTHSPGGTHYSHNTHSFNYNHFSNNDFVWNVNNLGATDERSEILAWLSPLEPRIRHQDLRTRRADHVGEWLLQTDEFQRWCNGTEQSGSEHATLFCYGDPAVGKTYFR